MTTRREAVRAVRDRARRAQATGRGLSLSAVTVRALETVWVVPMPEDEPTLARIARAVNAGRGLYIRPGHEALGVLATLRDMIDHPAAEMLADQDLPLKEVS